MNKVKPKLKIQTEGNIINKYLLNEVKIDKPVNPNKKTKTDALFSTTTILTTISPKVIIF